MVENPSFSQNGNVASRRFVRAMWKSCRFFLYVKRHYVERISISRVRNRGGKILGKSKNGKQLVERRVRPRIHTQTISLGNFHTVCCAWVHFDEKDGNNCSEMGVGVGNGRPEVSSRADVTFSFRTSETFLNTNDCLLGQMSSKNFGESFKTSRYMIVIKILYFEVTFHTLFMRQKQKRTERFLFTHIRDCR